MLLAKTENFLRRQGKPLVAFISRLCAFEASAAAKIIAFLHNPLADV